MQGADRIFLVGLMGSGKSTIGRHLSRQLGLAFVDSDREIEARTGAGIPLIFELEGEQGFRDRESRVIADLAQRPRTVLATGGGSVLREETRAALVSHGFVVWLRAPLRQLVERTRHDRSRPLLAGGDARETLARLAEERDPLYRSVADLIVDTAHRTVRDITQEIGRHFAGPCKPSP